MIGLDTNVLVRYIMQDDPRQSPKATQAIESLDNNNPGYVTLVVVVELYWVLTSCYELTNAQVTRVLDTLLRARQLVVERGDLVSRVLRQLVNDRADLPDCLIGVLAADAGCSGTLTFDVGASRHAGMTLLR